MHSALMGRSRPVVSRRMRSYVRPWAALLALASGAACMLSTSAAATSALLVVGNTDLNAGDSALKRRLERNYTTTVRDDGDAADPTKDVIVISGSVAAATLGGKYKTTAKGVVVLAPTVLPAMAMATAYGTLAGQTSIKIAGGSSTLAGGFATGALVPVYASARSIGWATPAATALKVALVASGTAGQVTIFRHLRGSAMVGGYLAPGRRVGYYLPAGDALSESGWQLLDNAVAHAAGLAALWPATSPPSGTELWPSPAWTVAAPAEVDMDPARLAKALSYGSSRGGSGIIVRHGRRVGYWGGQATVTICGRAPSRSVPSCWASPSRTVWSASIRRCSRCCPSWACRRAQRRARPGCR